MAMELEINGLDGLIAKLAVNVKNAQREAAAELYQFGEEVMTASRDLVPVDTGMLLNTGRVMMEYEGDDKLQVVLGYGDASMNYAVYVHEALEGPHPINPNWSWAKAARAGKQIQWSRPGSGPKYLERPLMERIDSLPGRIMAAYKRGLKS